MPWIISNGKSYVEIIGNNQMITTAYIDRAHTFNNKKTAEKYCSLLPKAMKNLKYKVIFISNPNPENPDLQLELAYQSGFHRRKVAAPDNYYAPIRLWSNANSASLISNTL